MHTSFTGGQSGGTAGGDSQQATLKYGNAGRNNTMGFYHKRFTYEPAVDSLLQKLHLPPESEEADDFRALLADVAPHAAPQAVVMTSAVSLEPEPPAILIGGVLFHGALLYAQLHDAVEVWPYIATCGRQAYDRVMAIPDLLERFWGEYILEDMLESARRGLDELFHHDIYNGKTASVAPGSLAEWSLEQQAPLFRLLGDAVGKCGVTLTESMLMLPNKTVSGIRFPSEDGYVSCVYCPRENCMKRQAVYDSSASWERT